METAGLRCSRMELQEVAALADELRVPEGRTLTVEGKSDRGLIVNVDGAAEVRRKGRKIRSRPLCLRPSCGASAA